MEIPKPSVTELMPEKRQELLELIGDPQQVVAELELSRLRLQNYDPSPEVVLILSQEK